MIEFYAAQDNRLPTNSLLESESNRKESILEIIKQFPGIRYRELLRKSRLSNGVLTHYLRGLEASKAIRISRKPRLTRYYPGDVPEHEYNILPFIRHEGIRQILLFILE